MVFATMRFSYKFICGWNMRRSVSVMALVRITLAAGLLSAIVIGGLPAAAQTNLSGLWDAVVVANGVEIPFRYEIAVRRNQAEGFFSRETGASAPAPAAFPTGC